MSALGISLIMWGSWLAGFITGRMFKTEGTTEAPRDRQRSEKSHA
jgi:hypothetical protein